MFTFNYSVIFRQVFFFNGQILFEIYLPAIGVLSIEELEGVRPLPLVAGVEVFLGVEEPKPTGVCL